MVFLTRLGGCGWNVNTGPGVGRRRLGREGLGWIGGRPGDGGGRYGSLAGFGLLAVILKAGTKCLNAFSQIAHDRWQSAGSKQNENHDQNHQPMENTERPHGTHDLQAGGRTEAGRRICAPPGYP